MPLNLHHCTEVDPLRRGLRLGTRWRSEIRRTAAQYTALFAAAGLEPALVQQVSSQCLDALDDWAPDLAREITGIARGSGLTTAEAATLNARTEVLVRGRIAGLSECTTAAWLPPKGGASAVQTWDWIPQADNFTVCRYTGVNGMPVAGFAENGVLGKLGVNGAGLAVMFTLLCHTSDGTTTGVPVHAIGRRVLDTARTVDEGIAIIRSAPVAASASFTLLQMVDDATAGVIVELAPSGSAVLPADDGYLLHTNHFLDPGLATGDRLAAVGDDSLPRLRTLLELAPVLTGGDQTAWATGLISHWEDGAPICAHPRPGAPPTDRWETKMTFSFDLERPSLLLHEGGPCRVTADGWKEIRP